MKKWEDADMAAAAPEPAVLPAASAESAAPAAPAIKASSPASSAAAAAPAPSTPASAAPKAMATRKTRSRSATKHPRALYRKIGNGWYLRNGADSAG